MRGEEHAFVQEWSAASPYCGRMVMRDGDGETCGLPRDHAVHQPARAEYHTVTLIDPDGTTVFVGKVIPESGDSLTIAGDLLVLTAHRAIHALVRSEPPC